MQLRKVRVIVSGIVQGVGFRYFTRQEATRLHLSGRATNLHDGTVEVIAYGDSRLVSLLIEWLKQGPRSARVDALQVEELEIDGSETTEFQAY